MRSITKIFAFTTLLLIALALGARLLASAWTDAPLQAGSTPIKKIHITELRGSIDTLRNGAGCSLGAFNWNDEELIRAQHILDLRTAITQVYTASGHAAPSWSTNVGVGSLIAAADINDIRNAVDVAQANGFCQRACWPPGTPNCGVACSGGRNCFTVLRCGELCCSGAGHQFGGGSCSGGFCVFYACN